MSHIKTLLQKHTNKLINKNLILLLMSLFVFLVPFLFWQGDIQVGGDDSKLYYQYPQEYLNNFTTKLISENQLGSMGNYFDQSYISPFIFLIIIVKKVLPFVDTQLFFYALNLTLSFFFFYQLVTLLQKSVRLKSNFIINILVSLFYSFSAFTYFTVWFHQLFAMYLLSFIPLILFLFIRSLESNNYLDIIWCIIASYIFSFTLLSIPWLIGAFIGLLPLFIYFIFRYKLKFFKNIFLLIVGVALVNIDWLFHFIYAPLVNSGMSGDVVSGVTSQALRTANEQSIISVSHGNSLLSIWGSIFHEGIQKNFNWNTWIVFANFYKYFLLPNFLFTIVVLLSLTTNLKKQKKNLLLILASGWLVSAYFFTVRIADWGLEFFLYLNRSVPGFTMFRNMYDKFGISMALNFALLLSFSIPVFFSFFMKKGYFKKLFWMVLIIMVGMNIYPFVTGKLFELSYASIPGVYNKNVDFNSDFDQVINVLAEIKSSSRVMWWPLNNSNYTIVANPSNEKEYYIGVSPLMILKGIPDFNGFLSFPSSISQQIEDALIAKDTQTLLGLLQKLNINYIVLDKKVSPHIQNSYLYSHRNTGDLFDLQTDPVITREILGDLILENDRYALYKINNEYLSQKIFVLNNTGKSKDVEFEKIFSYKYKLKISDIAKGDKIVFLDPYNSQWNLYDETMNPITTQKEFVYGYAMELIPLQDLEKNQVYYLYFTPHQYVRYLRSIKYLSLSVFVVIGIFILIKKYKRR